MKPPLSYAEIERLRQSGIRLDADGHFWHEGGEVTHHGLRAAFFRWLDRNPDGRWVLRRLSPHCSRIELAQLPNRRDESRLLRAMGYETGNVHLASPEAREAIQADLAARAPGWLHAASTRMLKSVREDYAEWRQRSGA